MLLAKGDNAGSDRNTRANWYTLVVVNDITWVSNNLAGHGITSSLLFRSPFQRTSRVGCNAQGELLGGLQKGNTFLAKKGGKDSIKGYNSTRIKKGILSPHTAVDVQYTFFVLLYVFLP